jgi:hypothetical protein
MISEPGPATYAAIASVSNGSELTPRLGVASDFDGEVPGQQFEIPSPRHGLLQGAPRLSVADVS